MPERSARRRLDQPAGPRHRFRVDVDLEAFGRLAEGLARFLGTGTYLLWQTVFVVAWIVLNLVGTLGAWDPYPFILLNLAFSTQAAYAAPLILLAQNRQDDRDRVALDEDRARATRTSSETEYLTREIASLRLSVGEMVTRDYLRSELSRRGATRPQVHGDTRHPLDHALDRALDHAFIEALEATLDRAVEKAFDRALGATPDR